LAGFALAATSPRQCFPGNSGESPIPPLLCFLPGLWSACFFILGVFPNPASPAVNDAFSIIFSSGFLKTRIRPFTTLWFSGYVGCIPARSHPDLLRANPSLWILLSSPGSSIPPPIHQPFNRFLSGRIHMFRVNPDRPSPRTLGALLFSFPPAYPFVAITLLPLSHIPSAVKVFFQLDAPFYKGSNFPWIRHDLCPGLSSGLFPHRGPHGLFLRVPGPWTIHILTPLWGRRHLCHYIHGRRRCSSGLWSRGEDCTSCGPNGLPGRLYIPRSPGAHWPAYKHFFGGFI